MLLSVPAQRFDDLGWRIEFGQRLPKQRQRERAANPVDELVPHPGSPTVTLWCGQRGFVASRAQPEQQFVQALVGKGDVRCRLATQ